VGDVAGVELTPAAAPDRVESGVESVQTPIARHIGGPHTVEPSNPNTATTIAATVANIFALAELRSPLSVTIDPIVRR
jgi:hypothetical protein